MMKSMTGFGRCELAEGNHKVTVEIKSVNHRYLDLTVKMPKKLNFFENNIRNLLKNYIQRGKVDVYVTYENCSENQIILKYNQGLAAEYVRYIRQMAEEFSLPCGLSAKGLAKYPEVLTMEAQAEDEEELWKLLEQAVAGAAEKFVEARAREGEQLRQDLLGKLEMMAGYVEQIEKRGDIIQTYEGVLLPYKNLMDSTRVYEGDFIFSTNDPAVAARLKEMQFANLPVRVIYSVYHTAMPWRGDRKIIITRVDSVNERDILPPDRQPEYLKESAK